LVVALLAVRPASGQAVAAPERALGKPDAQVTVIEYISLTCPVCARFHRETLPHVLKNYVETGQVRMVFRDYPLDGVALQAAVVARCMGTANVERYHAFVSLLFERQMQWADSRDPLAEVGRLARLGGLGPEQFQACLRNQELTQSVLTERQAGESEFRVRSTPTFVFNGRVVASFLNTAQFDEIVKPLIK
jgi:protein-disulfide isomerase